MECFLCLDVRDADKCIHVDSKEWSENRIQDIIDKHLGPIVETFPTPLAVTEGLCFLCWELLNNFHTFYEHLERIHNKRNKSLKEIEPLEEYLLEEIEEKSEIGIPNEQDEDIFGEKAVLEEIDVCPSSDNEDNHEKPDTGLPIDNVVEKTQQHNGTDNDSELDDSIAEAVKDDFPFPKSNGLRNPIEKHYIPHFIDDVPKRNKATYDSFLKEHFDITCDACFKPFETFALLVQHYSSEHKERGYVTCCETKFFFRHLLVDHIKYHLNPDYFKCTYCDNSFTTRRCLQVHIQLHEEKKYACSVCDKKFIKQSVLDNHKLKHFPPEKTIPCKDCGKFYVSQSALRAHQKVVHENLYARVCEICGQRLPNAFSYQQHKLKHDPKPAKCGDCGLVVTSEHTLRLHRKLKHPAEGNRQYNCHLCSKISPNARALKAHITDAHGTGSKYTCVLCGKIFKRSNKLRCHMSTKHTGTPTYSCMFCSKLFKASSTLTLHRRKDHPIEWEKERRKRYADLPTE